MACIGFGCQCRKLVAHPADGRKQRVLMRKQSASRLGLRTMIRQIGEGSKLIAFEAGNQMTWVAETLRKLNGVQLRGVGRVP